MKTRTLPQSHVPYTDKYFLRTNEILKKENISPRISMKIFSRGDGPVAGLDEAVEILTTYTRLREQEGEVWITGKERFAGSEPLMIIKGPVQSFIELETMYLGVLSSAISEALGIDSPDSDQITRKLKRLKAIYQDIPIIYFGARHYHWSLDKTIAAAAISGGAVQTSTDAGSSNIGLEGAGTTPHLLTIVLASIYGKENATLETARLFDKHMPTEVPRVTLVDTFNREITDTLLTARYFGKRKNSFRLDTCGENIGEGGSLYKWAAPTAQEKQKASDPEFKTGTGVTIELAVNVRNSLVENGFGPNTDIFLSSGFGNEDKARAFVNAHYEYKEKTGYNLFSGVGIGEISAARFCTADIFEVDDHPLAKTGREAVRIDYSTMKRVV
ncbi:MAG: nicotinate phosphoribosyltransferase [bacterium]|nr:nicotinate phosphoribosyltransferase [bacterium]